MSASALRKRIHSRAHDAEKDPCKSLGISGEEKRRLVSLASVNALQEAGFQVDVTRYG